MVKLFEMKQKLMIVAAASAAVFLSSCSERHNVEIYEGVPEAVVEAFAGMYPDATDVDWSEKDIYWVATFGETPTKTASGRNSAWYDETGNWYMTEQNWTNDRLPSAVADAFAASEYGSWRIEDIDYIRRYGVETVYVLEVEGEKDGIWMEVDLYYTESGVLVKEVVDADPGYDYGDFIPSRPSSSIEDFISQKYPGARIVDVENGRNGSEVEIVDGRVVRELYFDSTGNWIMTKTEVWYSSLPSAVQNVISTQYQNYRAEDADYYETADNGNFYRIELESRYGDTVVEIDAEGNILSGQPGSGQTPGQDPGQNPGQGPGQDPDHGSGHVPDYGGGSGESSTVAGLIEEMYPGAVILERDYDDGYLQIEIRHEGRSKDVYFNGRLEWVRTEWDVRYQELPEAVLNILNTDYSSYRIDDLTWVETPDTSYYLVELEGRYDDERRIRVTPDGTVL